MIEDSRGIERLEVSDAALFDHAARPRWFAPAALRPVTDINRRMLTLMMAQPPVLPVTEDIAVALRALPTQTLDRIARCPCLLVNAGFHDEQRWDIANLAAVLRSTNSTCERSPPAVVALARAAFFVAWHFARVYPSAADLVIGTRPASAQALRTLGVDDLEQLAAAHSDWIAPRWADRPTCWQQLLLSSQTSNGSFGGELRGLQLMLGQRWHDFSVQG